MKRHHNHGLRKICGCPRRLWPKCDHGWHLNFLHGGKGYRFSLDRHAGRHLANKTEALAEADVIRTTVRTRTFSQTVSAPQTLTVEELGRLYFNRYMKVHRKASVKEEQYRMNRLCRTVVPGPNGALRPIGSWSASVVAAETSTPTGILSCPRVGGSGEASSRSTAVWGCSGRCSTGQS